MCKQDVTPHVLLRYNITQQAVTRVLCSRLVFVEMNPSRVSLCLVVRDETSEVCSGLYKASRGPGLFVCFLSWFSPVESHSEKQLLISTCQLIDPPVPSQQPLPPLIGLS